MVEQRIIPHSQQAEALVLGEIIRGGRDSLDEISERICSHHFYTRSNRIIFDEIQNLARHGKHIDPHTIFDALQKSRLIDEVGGISAISNISMTLGYSESQIDILEEKYRLRSLIEITNKAQLKAYDSTDSKQLISEVEGDVFSLSQNSIPVENNMEAAVAELDELLDSEKSIGIQTGIRSFDEPTGGLLPGRYYAVAARPKQGKTALACQAALNMIMRDIPGLYISLEMTHAQLLGRMASNLSDVEYAKALRRKLSSDEKARIRNAYYEIKKKPLIIQVPSSIAAHEIRSEIRKAKRKHGIKFVVLDYIQKIKVERGDARNSIAEASEAIRATCKETGVAAIVVCQLNREAEKERPRLGHLKESGAIEQDADVVCLLYAKDKEEVGQLRTITLAFDANRNGPQCDEEMLYDGRFLKFKEKAFQYQPRPTPAKILYSE